MSNIDPKVLALLGNHNKSRAKRSGNAAPSMSSGNYGINSNQGGLKNIKLSVTCIGGTETLKRRFSGDNTVDDVCEAILDQVPSINKNFGERRNKNNGMTIIILGKAQKSGTKLSSIKGIKGDGKNTVPVHISFGVDGGAYDSKQNKERVRLADFENEKRITPTLEPDCIYGYDEMKLRVKMPCGHVFDSNTMYKLTQMYVNNFSKSSIECPVLSCKKNWDLTVVAAAADLDEKEDKVLGRALECNTVTTFDGDEESTQSFLIDQSDEDCKQNDVKKATDFSRFCTITKGNCCGLSNLVNTCFMNTALQCLMHAPYFTRELLGVLEQMDKFQLTFKGGNVLKEWMYILYYVHCSGKCGSNPIDIISPKQLKKYLSAKDEQFGDKDQHDACDALLVILNIIENEYNKLDLCTGVSKRNGVKAVPIELKHSVFDGEASKEDTDEEILKQLQSNGYLRVENVGNIVTKHFGAVQVTTNTCMNCGFGNRIYELLNSIKLPITNECIKLTLLKYNSELNEYNYAFKNVNIVSNSKIKLAKFYGLHYDNRKKVRDIKHFDKAGSCSELDNWDILRLKSVDGNNGKYNGKIATILSDNDRLQELITENEIYSSLLMVPNEVIFNSNGLSSIFDNVYFKLVVCYILPLELSSKLGNEAIYFSVLNIPFSKRNMALNCEQLQQELKNTKQYKSIACRSKKYTMIIDINGHKYDNKSEECFILDENCGNIICTWKENKIVEKKYGILKDCENKSSVWKEITDTVFQDPDNKRISYTKAKKLLDNKIASLENNCDDSVTHYQHSVIATVTAAIDRSKNKMKEGKLKRNQIRVQICKNFKCLFEMALSDDALIGNGMKQFELLHDIDKNYPFVKMNSNKKKLLCHIKKCIDLYYQVSYVSSCTFELKCKCKEYAPIVCIKKELLNSPNVLILKFNRGDITVDKTSHTVLFGKELESEQLLNEKYNLFGVGYHGGSSVGGHYTASIKKLGTENEWYYCDDYNVFARDFDPDYRSCKNAMFVCFAKE